MGMDIPTSGAIIGRGLTVRAGTRRDYPRLAPTASADARAPSRDWVGTLGNTLLEMPWLFWSAFDLLLVTAALYLGYRSFVWTPLGGWVEFSWWQTCLVLWPAFVFSGLVFGLYEQQTLLRRSRILARSVLTITAAVALTYIAIYLFMYAIQSRRVLFLVAGLYMGVGPVIRLLVCSCINSYSRKFLIVGTDRKSRLSPAGSGDALSRRYRLIGYLTTDAIEVGRWIDGYPVLGTVDDIERICIEHQVNEIVVGRVASKNPWLVDKTLTCLRLGCRVTNLSTFYEEVLSEVPAALLEPNWFLFADLKHYREAQLIVKRAFDITCSLIGLLLSLPLWPLLALLIRLDSPGPVFYGQVRIGLNGRPFRLHKFRTMHVGAEANGHAWAAENDPRVTGVGRYLRKLRFDELPQLWNVLLGEMSMVGPRPERPEFVEELAVTIRFFNERHLIKPGLTGWAQIHYRYGASVEDALRKLQLDLWYIKHMSLELDLSILLRTLGTVFLGSR